MLVHSFILPSIGDLKFSALHYDDTCMHLDINNIHDADTE